jgi:hypothetical protein
MHKIIYKLLIILTFLFTKQVFATEFLGGIQGNLSVNQGAANYNIPLDLPKGVNGLKPKLGINYNSNSGNGILGVGFGL